MIETLELWRRRVWIDRDETAIDEMMAHDTTAHGLGTQVLAGPNEFKSFHRALCSQLRDTDLVIDHHIEAAGWLAALCTFKGATASGKRIAITGSIHARIAEGKILEAYNHFDFVGLFAQLDLLPADTFPRCLSGLPACAE